MKTIENFERQVSFLKASFGLSAEIWSQFSRFVVLIEYITKFLLASF